MKAKTILIATGGTGGHVFPGLAVAEEFRFRGYDVHWLGTEVGLESTLVPKKNIPIHYFPVSGVRGKGFIALLLSPWNILRAVYFALKKIKALNPKCVIGMGGFVSGPAGVASRMLGIPLIIHEQNAVAGTTNRLLSKVASKVLCAFPGSLEKACAIGNPLRPSLELVQKTFDRRKHKLNLLVLGGSRGAKALNNNVPKALHEAGLGDLVNIKHQCGVGRTSEAESQYEKNNICAEVLPFIDDMEAIFSWADVLICRAGALTVSEVAAVGVASIMIPYPYAIDDHQTANARFLEKNGATEIVQESDFDQGRLAIVLKRLLTNKEKIKEMSTNAKRVGKLGVAKRFVDVCESIPQVAT